MYVACSSLCFGRYSLAQALHTIAELRFHKVDLALHESGPHLKPSDVVADINRAANLLRKSNASFAAFHVEIESPDKDAYRETLRAVCRLGRMLAAPVVIIPAAPLGSDTEEEAARLTVLRNVADGEGVMLTVETNCQTLTADPAKAIELCQRVPGLGLTLDPSHYMVGDYAGRDFDDLYPFVRHVRLRDTGRNQLQVKVGQGQLEYGKIISQLYREQYQRALSVDIRDCTSSSDPSEPEVRKLKYLLESMV